MNLKSFSLFLLVSILMSFQLALADNKGFHPPQTEAEKTLDIILKYDDADWLPRQNILTRKPSDSLLEKKLTKKLKKTLADAEEEEVKQNCGGKYIAGDLCGLDFDPITCAQDYNDVYIYHTEKSNINEVIITYSWPWGGPIGTYKLVYINNNWQIDGIDCKTITKFNMQ